MNKPDFLIIGAAKSGTTSLYFYLLQHPRIFLPVNKEPFFFAFENQNMQQYRFLGHMLGVRNAVVNIDQYQELFSRVPKDKKCGEASTLYLYLPKAPERIYAHIPDAKLIAILRNPVDRAYSHFRHFRREGFEPIEDFYSAVCAEKQRIQENWFPSYFYIDAGFYSRQIKRYYEFFPKAQLKIFLYEDLKRADVMVREIFDFLDVEPISPRDTTSVHNISGTVRFPGLYQQVKGSLMVKPFFRRIIPPGIWSQMRARWERMVIAPPEPLSREDRCRLIDIFHAEILELELLINRDLSSWLKPD